MAAVSRTFAWVGLGRIVEHHLDALAAAQEIGVAVAGCDVDAAARGRFAERLETFASLEEMLDRVAPDVLVIATPTPTHAEVCRRVVALGAPKTVLVEKPLATTMAEVDEILDGTETAGIDLRCLYHAAYGPEVEWALANLGRELQAVTSIESELVDPYSAVEAAIYGDSWLDSGINALSIVSRFVNVESRFNLTEVRANTFLGLFDAGGASGALRIKIATSWRGVNPSKVTRVDLRDGGIVILNHQAMLARYCGSDGSAQTWTSPSALPRLTQHYVAAFRHELLRSAPAGRDRLLHALLL